MAVMDGLAPCELAEHWDRIGLQVGHENWPADRIWIALDPTVCLMDQASKHGVDLVITHHPLLFNPVTRIDPGTPQGRMIEIALKREIGIFSAHTNLDSVSGGVNDVLAEKLELHDTRALQPAPARQYRMVTYVPEGYEDKVAEAMFASGAGRIGEYTEVSFRTPGTGTFKPSEKANPFSGKTGNLTRASEYRLEVLVPRGQVTQVVKALVAAHPYEEVVYDIYSTQNRQSAQGLGRIGFVDPPIGLEAFVLRIKKTLGLRVIKVAGRCDGLIRLAALCAGSAKGLLDTFLDSDAQVFIGGDFGYHDGRAVEETGRAIIDIGHFASEYPVVQSLCRTVKKALAEAGHSAEVTVYANEKDSFELL